MRTKFLIGPKLQAKFLAAFVFSNFLVALGFLYSAVRFIDVFKLRALEVGIPEGHYFYLFLSEQKQTLLLLTFLGILFTLAITTLLTIYLSHKIAGPVYRIEQDLTEMFRTNKFREIKIRQDDDLQEVVVLVNKLISKSQQS